MKKAFVIALIASVSIGSLLYGATPPKMYAPIPPGQKATGSQSEYSMRKIATVTNKSPVKIAVDFIAKGCKGYDSDKDIADYEKNIRSICKSVILKPGQSFTYIWPADPVYYEWSVGQAGRVVIKPLTGKTEKDFIYDRPFKPIIFTGSIEPTPAPVPVPLTKKQPEKSHKLRVSRRRMK